MKFYQQSGSKLQRTNLAESDHICECCESYDHGAHDYQPDDAVCERCHSLCCCSCHRDSRSLDSEAPRAENAEEVSDPEAT